jgi:hypothetical protein
MPEKILATEYEDDGPYFVRWVDLSAPTKRQIYVLMDRKPEETVIMDSLETHEPPAAQFMRHLLIDRAVGKIIIDPSIPHVRQPDRAIGPALGIFTLPGFRQDTTLISLFKPTTAPVFTYLKARDAFLEQANREFARSGLIKPFPPYRATNRPVV